MGDDDSTEEENADWESSKERLIPHAQEIRSDDDDDDEKDKEEGDDDNDDDVEL